MSISENVKTSMEIPLLGGKFYTDDSHGSILELLLDLQSYHQQRNFSHQERFGKPDPWSEKMLVNLHEALEQTKFLIDQAKSQAATLSLKSSMTLT